MKKIIITLGLFFGYTIMYGQNAAVVPTTVFAASDASKPLLFYISGDGGMNKFSTSLAQAFAKNGYATIALDSRSYFWKKKDPQAAAAELSTVIQQYNNKFQRKNIVVIGYSFGADVLPFVFNRFNNDLQQKTSGIILLSPSTTTDFEVHVSDMLGFKNKNKQNVPSEINKLTKPVLFVFGEEEKEYPINKITLKNKQIITLSGGHHYDSDINYLCNQLLQHIR